MLTQTHTSNDTRIVLARFIPALSAIVLGFTLILTVGFVPVDEVHNATHDTRHATGFPCH